LALAVLLSGLRPLVEQTAPFRGRGVLPEEHEQDDDETYRLLVAQLDFQCQFEHGSISNVQPTERSVAG
jgi:hypothetical protein